MKKDRKGIILAGGTGSRLYPITRAISKQLMPIYDKPMIYYPLTTLMLAGIRDFLIIVNPKDLNNFNDLLGNGEKLGISIKYEIQHSPDGLAQALIIGEEFLDSSPCALILGDNLLHGEKLVSHLENPSKFNKGATIFACQISNPERYGVVEFDNNKKVKRIEEKPKNPKSNFVVTGLYFYDNTAVEKAKLLKPSKRGELEISDLNNLYLNEGSLTVEFMNRGLAWFDTGSFNSLHEASSYIKTLENRQGLKVGCPEEVSWRNGWIDTEQLKLLAEKNIKSGYGNYLLNIIPNENS